MLKKISNKLKKQEAKRDDTTTALPPPKALWTSISNISEPDSADSGFFEAVCRNDVDEVRKYYKSNKTIINVPDSNGRTALHKASARGYHKIIMYLLSHGADLEKRDKQGKTALYSAVENGHVNCVGIIVDFIHSVDRRPRAPFILLRSIKSQEKNLEDDLRRSYVVEQSRSCSVVKSFSLRNFLCVEILLAHGQAANDLGVFLYQTLDIPTKHILLRNVKGDMNTSNISKCFPSKTITLTILKSSIRAGNLLNFSSLKNLIIVECGMRQLQLEGLDSLESLDVSENRLTSLPASIGRFKQLKVIRAVKNHLTCLPPFELTNLEILDVSWNQLKILPNQLCSCTSLRQLNVSNNQLISLPEDIGLCSQLRTIDLEQNKLKTVPTSLSTLNKLKDIILNYNPLEDVSDELSVQELKSYLRILTEDPVPCNTMKMVVVGQEKCGKTSLIKRLHPVHNSTNVVRRLSQLKLSARPNMRQASRVKSVDVRQVNLGEEIVLKIFDCGGSADLYDDHGFFLTAGAVYVTVFKMNEWTECTVERSNFLLGRLQLWLSYIYSKAPNASVIIVGTHADHSSLNDDLKQEIWTEVRKLLSRCKIKHTRMDSCSDCILCTVGCLPQRRPPTGNLTANDIENATDDSGGADGVQSPLFSPHIIAYFEVSSPDGANIESLKTYMENICRKTISLNSYIPRRWSQLQDSLNRIEKPVITMDEMAKLAQVHGVKNDEEFLLMLARFANSGSVVTASRSNNTVIVLQPEWLAKCLSTIHAIPSDPNNVGLIQEDLLLKQLDQDALSFLLSLSICIRLSGTKLLLAPSRLPAGYPPETSWRKFPEDDELQFVFMVTLPTIAPPSFFPDLTVALRKNRTDEVYEGVKSTYLLTHIVEVIDGFAYHIQLKRNVLLLEIRTTFDRDIHEGIDILDRILDKVTSTYEGLKSQASMNSRLLNTIICPGCLFNNVENPARFPSIILSYDDESDVSCEQGHQLGANFEFIKGQIPKKLIPKEKSDLSAKCNGFPTYFVVLPAVGDGLNIAKQTIYPNQYSAYALHAVCEFPDGLHISPEEGLALHRNVDEIMHKYGPHTLAVLQLLRITSDSSVLANDMAVRTKQITQTLDGMLKDLEAKFKISTLKYPLDKVDSNFLRSRLNLASNCRRICGLTKIQFDGRSIWVCDRHYRQLLPKETDHSDYFNLLNATLRKESLA
ncbi:unnamed protein product [Dimorphilus gyrociliatus]|uniref:non-specific serine/threonine protein kinase n=1 Tax=Dimorphilus gyrociliatus TaxID=2664684 RepID=A0A7I8VVT4_9ANNE|nr:unnamed protein product [Dimorphilus gyrociliatus]